MTNYQESLILHRIYVRFVDPVSLSWFHWLFFPSSRGVCTDLAVAYQRRVTRPSRDDAAAIHWLSAVGLPSLCISKPPFCRRLRTSPATFPSSLLFVFVFFLPSGPFSLESLRPSSYTDGLLPESFHSQKAHSLSLLAYDSADARYTVTFVSVSRCLSPSHSMSSSIAIPVGPWATPSCHKGTVSSANSPYSTSPSCSPPLAGKDKALHARRPSLLSSFLSKQECTVINIGEPNGPPRLVSDFGPVLLRPPEVHDARGWSHAKCMHYSNGCEIRASPGERGYPARILFMRKVGDDLMIELYDNDMPYCFETLGKRYSSSYCRPGFGWGEFDTCPSFQPPDSRPLETSPNGHWEEIEWRRDQKNILALGFTRLQPPLRAKL
ncbi:Uncharacterized protein HZ326_28202 [Fusarium oxysporum f. sp. albedinis]|nr:Uncharacterized protein HZ326_28202 [Fusarium oxysporum f. sp. albedinis]